MMIAPPHKDYSATPLNKKLGLITSKGHIAEAALLGAPANFRGQLGDLPADLALTTKLRKSTKLALCFVRTAAELATLLDLLPAQLPAEAHFWIIYPKAHRKAGFNENHVRDQSLAAGFVDYKVCSVDADWSGLKFARRKQ
ncbi:MAG: DUF3052 family protein [Acidobacteriota bacterium]